ncbi:Zinc finger, CCCH-type [Corchorus olitorius]|uniref:Zinc finger, CCCH-type n=1 Tax=Corchorus olitorius TaxID=93759 RepID=A0A1R3KI31_9ROSI|nr:Zinc finger, CCCH-type [Corchorus olitorius]
MTSSTIITKPRTWHRTNDSSTASPTPLSANKPSFTAQTQMSRMAPSYIRKGNTLVRKPVSVPTLSHPQASVYRRDSRDVDELKTKKGAGPNSKADSVDLRTGDGNAPFERPTTPPLFSFPKVPNPTSTSNSSTLHLPVPSFSGFCETTTNHASSIEVTDVIVNSPEDGLNASRTTDSTGADQNESNLAPSSAKRVMYVKPKSNQLVETSDCGRACILNADRNQPFPVSSDGYYKKRKNQLIRTALDSHSNEAVNISGGKRRSNKVVVKTHKPSKFSLVWTLHSARLSNNDGYSLRHPKVLPHLFPWKRMTYWRSFKLNSVSSCNSSLSTIGRKMLLLRKRNTVYTRSINGFSIRKSKVLSVGGSSLKWSKSIETLSRKANEEATLAVAEAERKKREWNHTISGTGKRGYSCRKVVHGTELRSGERIFRIGSVRYKMDSSRRSLQRISDDESSCSAGRLSENNAKKSYVPRRLVIGNDEYVRVGNGNQLVRNPKKRTRVLASEKVRWSLHTARLRLVKKKKYCQFFTRFGKCNKDDGKCPYIHDPSKIAVCTKFLKGLCTNPNCKLTHKVIPDRMPDCSYYLQGLCTNENCPYRHVHVNPNASTCEGFLKGYCADGNECRKKHSYVCPNFEVTGSCPHGSKCKLHHPKKRSRTKKSKRSMEHKNAYGRYFGIDILEPKRVVSDTERHQALDDDDKFCDVKFSDYICLDVSDDEAGEVHRVINDQMAFGDNDSSDLQLDDPDELIKPIRIMNR